MIPLDYINVIDSNEGFTAITTKNNDTLWRPKQILKGNYIGSLLAYSQDSFYQNNNDVTKAIYKVKGYRYHVVLWFDNKTGKRIA
jgi:hypothetical protein